MRRLSLPRRRMTRRDFLARLVGALGGAMAALLGIPGAIFVIGGSQQETAGDWVALGPVTEFPLGQPKLINTTVAKQRGWTVEQQELSVFVSTNDGSEFLALSDRCTHLACRVRFVEKSEPTSEPGYFCPCHDGFFDASGGIVAGPIPKPLLSFETRVEDGQLFVKEA